MRKLSVKIIFALLLIIIMTPFITPVMRAVLGDKSLLVITDSPLFRFAIIGTAFVVLSVFAFLINIIIVSRIQRLNDAMNEVAKGNFDIQIESRGYDELSQLTHRFNEMTAELKSNEYLSKDFARNVSHEFKTPLSGLRGYAELIEQESQDDAIKDYAKIIVSEADRLAKLSSGLLQLSLLESTERISCTDSFMPSEQIRGVLITSLFKIEEKKLELDVDCEDFTFKSNEKLVYQVWQNLIGNAIKFTGENGKITIRLKKCEDGLQFEVSDSGIGIESDTIEKIFDLFVVGNKHRSEESNGIGLTLTKKIVDKLGGTIGATSKVGEGTTFFVTIPNS